MKLDFPEIASCSQEYTTTKLPNIALPLECCINPLKEVDVRETFAKEPSSIDEMTKTMQALAHDLSWHEVHELCELLSDTDEKLLL